MARSTNTDDRVRIRAYRHGLGDSFLLRFPKSGASGGFFHIVIDSGVLLGTANSAERMIEVAEDIHRETNGVIDVLVVTHEHWDHVSGFSEQQAQAVWDTITIKSVWLAWTEDPKDTLAKELRADREENVTKLRLKLASAGSALQMDSQRASRLRDLLAFEGLSPSSLGFDLGADSKGGGTAKAMKYVRDRVDKPKFLRPGDIEKLSGVAKTRVFVLGPPHDKKKIKKSNPSQAKPEVYSNGKHGAKQGQRFDGDDAEFDSFERPPFADDLIWNECAFEAFASTTQSEALTNYLADGPRKLATESLEELEKLAIALDGATNNSSLVLAFELEPKGNVLLFVADAQVGNWLSWQEVTWDGAKGVSANDLFERTVFYKVGHHGSHNATLKDLGLEKMTNKNLVALVPVNKKMAKKKHWKMPFCTLWKRLKELTRGRTVLTDDKTALPDEQDLENLTSTERKRFQRDVVATDLAIDFFV